MQEPEPRIERRFSRWVPAVAYWSFTLIVASEMAAGSMWDLLHIEYVRDVLTHLGYPLYLATILGIWKLPCAITLMVPRFLRLKEWAYAGAVFNYTGASASHLFAGDHASKWVPPLVFALVTLASYVLRPPARRLPRARDDGAKTSLAAWLVPLAVVAAFVVLALVTLPKGRAPF